MRRATVTAISFLLGYLGGTALAADGPPASAPPSGALRTTYQPRHPEPVKAIAACMKALRQLATKATFDSGELFHVGCSQLYAEPACRDAMRRFDQVEPSSREVTLALACRTAYCRLLPEPKPTLCKVALDATTPTDLETWWLEFNKAVFAFDLARSPGDSAQTDALAEAMFRPIYRQVPVKAPPPALPTLQLHLLGTGSAVTVRIDLPDSQEREVHLDSPPSAADRTRLAEVLAAVPKSTQIALAVALSTPHKHVVDVMEVLHDLGYKRLALMVPSK